MFRIVASSASPFGKKVGIFLPPLSTALKLSMAEAAFKRVRGIDGSVRRGVCVRHSDAQSGMSKVASMHWWRLDILLACGVR